MRTQIAIALTSCLVLGCGVKKETHQKVVRQLTSTQVQLDQTRTERDALLVENRGLATDKKKQAKTRSEQVRVQASEPEILALRRQRAVAEMQHARFQELSMRLDESIAAGKLNLSFRHDQIILELPAAMLFPAKRATLTRKGKASLQEILEVLIDYQDQRFVIAGHTDDTRVRTRRFKSNWQLSTAQAVSVIDFMVKSSGFAASKLAAAGYGGFAPLVPNSDAESRAKNRRIEIILVPDIMSEDLPPIDKENPVSSYRTPDQAQ